MNLKEPKKIEDMETIVDYAYYHRYRYLKYHEAFRVHFGKHLSEFWQNNLLGFDIVKFDKWINPEQEKSLEQIVREKHGEGAVQLIRDLL